MKHFFLIIAIGLLACNQSKSDKKPLEEAGQKILLARIILPDSTIDVRAVKRVITKTVQLDSATGKDKIVTKMFCGRPVPQYVIDPATQKPKLDSLGKPIISPYPDFALIGNDSVDFHVENIDLDSLLKRRPSDNVVRNR